MKRIIYRTKRTGGDVRFREGDYKYSDENYKITNIYLTPGSVPMYVLREWFRGQFRGQELTGKPIPYHEVITIKQLEKTKPTRRSTRLNIQYNSDSE